MPNNALSGLSWLISLLMAPVMVILWFEIIAVLLDCQGNRTSQFGGA